CARKDDDSEDTGSSLAALARTTAAKTLGPRSLRSQGRRQRRHWVHARCARKDDGNALARTAGMLSQGRREYACKDDGAVSPPSPLAEGRGSSDFPGDIPATPEMPLEYPISQR